VNHWTVATPYEWSGVWEGRVQKVSDHDTRTDRCGHLHASFTDAMRCAQEAVQHRNSDLMVFDIRKSQSMPPDYYLD
jgi:hypothetical protein